LGQLRVPEFMRARQIVAPRLPQQHPFQLSTAIADPKSRALLLVKVVDHDLVLDVVEHTSNTPG
jgi:hypothetical protein